METYHIMTFGCQMNENDSEKIAGIVETLGLFKTHDVNSADLIIINTCSVRENANNKFFGNLGSLKKLKEEKEDLIVAVCGCMMQEKHVVDTLMRKYKFVDIVFGTHNLGSFPTLLNQAREDNNMAVEILPDAVIEEDLPIKREFSHKAFVSIMNGCDNFCSFCIVPYTRGREKSRKSENIIKEISKLTCDGVKEVTLLGQNVNSYGQGMDEKVTFAELLEKVSDIEGIERIRFMTSHPKDLSDELIKVIKNNEKVCNHIHLPIQSGSSKVLNKMNRKYDKKAVLELVEKIRKEIPSIAITTDIIVGFPGESEEDFLDTLNIYEKCNFDSAFTYIYSPREGTRAAKMEYNITNTQIKDRFDRLLSLHDKIMREHHESLIGEVVEVLVEGKSKKKDEFLTGRTDTFKLVNFKAEKETKVGDIVSVKIEKVNTFNLTGKQVSYN